MQGLYRTQSVCKWETHPHPYYDPPGRAWQSSSCNTRRVSMEQLTKIENKILYLTGVSRTLVLRTEENRRYVLCAPRVPKTEIFQSPPDPFPPRSARGHLITRGRVVTHHYPPYDHHNTIFCGEHLFAAISMNPDNRGDKNTLLWPSPFCGDLAHVFWGAGCSFWVKKSFFLSKISCFRAAGCSFWYLFLSIFCHFFMQNFCFLRGWEVFLIKENIVF